MSDRGRNMSSSKVMDNIEEQDHLVRESNYSLYMDLKRLLDALP
jgi:hypothetical protein